MTEVKDYFGGTLGGWVPDIPDQRDFLLSETPVILRMPLFATRKLDSHADLREFFPAVEDQMDRHTTVAFSCGTLIEYFNRRCLGHLVPVSKPFLDDVTRRIHGLPGDCGISIRQVLKALSRVGIPPVSCTNQGKSRFDDLSCDPLLYSFARDNADVSYFRVDTPNCPPDQQIDTIRRLLQIGIPVVFGMPLLSSLTQDSRVDCAQKTPNVIGGTTGVLVGFDDSYRISSKGAFLFRSSWGRQWGEHGYGWLSYNFFKKQLVRDIWVVFRSRWADHGDLPLDVRS